MHQKKKTQTVESKYRAIIEAVPDIVMEVDSNKVYTWANKWGYEFFGNDVIGKEALFYFEGEQNTYKIVEPLMSDRDDIVYVENWQRRKDGEKRLLAWWCHILKNKKGNIKGVLSTARDITNVQNILKEKEMLMKELQHRVKNNLTIISSLIELEAGGIEEEAIKAKLSSIKDRIHSIISLYSLLYQTNDVDVINLNEYLNQIISFLHEDHHTKLNIEFESIVLDVKRAMPLGLILNELYTNCLKYAFPKEDGTITIKLYSEEENIILEVNDNGIGIGPEPHNGLGLTLVGMLTDQLNGELKMTNKSGTNVRVKFKL